MRHNYNGLMKDNPRVYKSWHMMISRCENKRNGRYPRYGGRGIRVCAEWKYFPTFLEWADKNGYWPDGTIERVNNDGDYCPNNCRWATLKDQSRNRSNTILYEYNGESRCLPEWAEIYSLKTITLVCRVRRQGWTMKRALNERPQEKDKSITISGRTQKLSQWASESGLSKDLIYLRGKRGWPAHRLLEAPANRGQPPC